MYGGILIVLQIIPNDFHKGKNRNHLLIIFYEIAAFLFQVYTCSLTLYWSDTMAFFYAEALL